jgi:hypothetical protein
VWNKKTPLDVANVHLTETGFELTFTKPIVMNQKAAPMEIKGRRYYYQYHEMYGSPQTDVHELKITSTNYARDEMHARIDIDELVPGYIYELTLQKLKAKDGSELLNPLVCYTANRLLDGSKAPVPRPTPTGITQGSGKDKPKAVGGKPLED